MKKNKRSHCIGAVLLLFVLGITVNTAQAQLEEPDVIEKSEPKTPLSEGYHNDIGFDVVLNNFGFGIGGHYSRVLGDYTELTFQTAITGIRDVSEQNFQNFFTGNQIIPNRYKRAFGFPFLLGMEQRIFARQIEDSFRLFVGGAVGPAMAFTYPYINDADGSGFRTYVVRSGFLRPTERVNDFFTGWSEGESHWGYSGELKIGADIGSSFGTRTTVEFGYFFYYFSEGLQLMEPYRPYGYDENGNPVIFNAEGEQRPHFDAQKYFGTPQIKFTFGSMW
ncbi:hypothetical protein LQ318_11260 [Aliifodinibius salicampi]|uniref:Outer membrane protein beta-barrel domain-containing protein n=1 Tax=Fodinibius salicampi TaxID=1920655 RepID=A0ABT3Q026_9BACT|nr:hypothetical protein [Fodinibius salicampi]MCW9713482.1 hypothetical protein [Fodinibius salicampi]